MKKLDIPNIDPVEVYKRCVSGITAADLAARFNRVASNYEFNSRLYATRSTVNQLHLFASYARGNENQVVFKDLTKSEFTSLYTTQMVKRSQPGRSYYDHLLNSVPSGKCPYCGFGQATTLDHYLPKSLHPIFSVLPANLVPACKDCNTGKGSGKFTSENLISHPYFEDSRIETEIWLYATVEETSPVTATFWVDFPNSWPIGLKTRVYNYFNNLNLALRFSVEAASELTSLSDLLREIGVTIDPGEFLSINAEVERSKRKNTWKAALYEALSLSNWYRDGGWQQLV